MINRRRSDRFRVELPVSLMDAQGREETTTADVSLHGISVFARRPRALRQYVELEVTLPQAGRPLRLTAFVARLVIPLFRRDGTSERGLALDIYHFEADAKAEWQRLIGGLRAGESDGSAPIVVGVPLSPPKRDLAAEAEPPSDPPHLGTSSPGPEGVEGSRAGGTDDREDTEEAPPTFIIQPRDVARMWSFLRGEMTRELVRIEAPIAKARGAAVEVLVVHPETQVEWSLAGRVRNAIAHPRASRYVLEIELDDVGERERTAFGEFISSGGTRAPDVAPVSRALDEDDGSVAGNGKADDALEETTLDDANGPRAPLGAEDVTGHLFSSFFLEAAAARPPAGTLVPISGRSARGGSPSVPESTMDARAVGPGGEVSPPGPFADERVARGAEFEAPIERRLVPDGEGGSFGHVDLSTEGSNPTLDRDIAIARARVVRSPNSVTACYRLGTLLMRRGHADCWGEAIDALRRVMELEPNHPGAHHAVAEAFAKRGDLSSAREHLQRARRLGYQIDPELERRLCDLK